jgi:hypothetical protein
VEADGQEQLVVVAEVQRGCRDLSDDELIARIRRSVLEQHDLPAYAVLLLQTGRLPKTTSGKVQHHECRRAFLDETFSPIASWIRGEQLTRDSDADQPATRRDAPSAEAIAAIGMGRHTPESRSCTPSGGC